MAEIRFSVAGLRIPFKTSFKQASSVRNTGESVWVVIERNGIQAFGEGCPRIYVTGETLESAIGWINEQLPDLRTRVTDLPSLHAWMEEQRTAIDENPAAFCAVETALVDLFAKEQNKTVEALLGLAEPGRVYQYTAVVGDGSADKFMGLVEQYLEWGFNDFKLKINGDLATDIAKFEILSAASVKAGRSSVQIRLDANNLWAGQKDLAIEHLKQLPKQWIGIEEPIAPKEPQALSEISTTLGQGIILDESLCNRQDILAYDALPGKYIANLKVARLGGVLRSLEMVRLLQTRNWPIIVGAHVGETSVLTRAAMLVANAAGQQLIAQEGAFGTVLLDYDRVSPSLRFGAGGRLDLREYKFNNTPGWGLTLAEDN